ncbi:MAG: hypothetical protein U0165_12950 [Polyangiaceae bacterium]
MREPISRRSLVRALGSTALVSVLAPSLVAGCSSKQAPLPTTGPKRKATAFLTPDELLPTDAGFVIRIDRQRVKSGASRSC